MKLPDRLDSERLTLRPWAGTDAAALQSVVLNNVGHLRNWMPWATPEGHADLREVARRLTAFGDAFASGLDFGYVMTDRIDGTLIGAVGVHPRLGPDVLEIGYWIRADYSGRGLVTEAVGALVDMIFSATDVTLIEIRCDPRNAPSAAVARRAGFTHVETRVTDVDGIGTRETMIWELRRA